MNYISQQSGYWLLLIFGISMTYITYITSKIKHTKTKEYFLVAGRDINWFIGGSSIAASWIWAPALFISVQLAYQKGLAGIFWFTLPNIIALALFAFLAPRIRKLLPDGYTLPQYIQYKLQNNTVHKIYLIPYFFYQIMAITVQLFAGGNLISALTGIHLTIAMPILAIIALVYTLISGLRSSIITDFIQIIIIIGVGALILPMVWSASGGFSSIQAGFAGIEGIRSIFDAKTAFSLGIVTSIGLIAGAISDQQYWQRSFAIKKEQLVKSFIFGALLFGVVPLALSTLGFIAANPDLNIILPTGIDVSMIGVQTVATLLPSWATLLFVIMLMAGLSSTLDSGLSATSSLWVTDIKKMENGKDAIKSARLSMIGITLIGLLIAYAIYFIPSFGLFHLWWIFNTVAATVVIPTLLSLYWDKLSARGVIWGVTTAFVIGLPLFIYGNIIENEIWTVSTILFILLVSSGFCIGMQKKI